MLCFKLKISVCVCLVKHVLFLGVYYSNTVSFYKCNYTIFSYYSMNHSAHFDTKTRKLHAFYVQSLSMISCSEQRCWCIGQHFHSLTKWRCCSFDSELCSLSDAQTTLSLSSDLSPMPNLKQSSLYWYSSSQPILLNHIY